MLGTSLGSVKGKWKNVKVISSHLSRSNQIDDKCYFFQSQENAIEASVWTKEDDEELLKWVSRFGGKNWEHVAAKLNRSLGSVRGRYKR